MNRCPERVTELIINYLTSKGLYNTEFKCDIRKSELGGLGIFAREDISPGDLIFIDFPVIIGPRSTLPKDICVVCFKNDGLKLCRNNCHLPVCSIECQNTQLHQKEYALINKWTKSELNNGISETNYADFVKYITPIRGLILSEEDLNIVRMLKRHKGVQHGFEIDILCEKYGLEINQEERDFMYAICRVLDANAFEVIVGNEGNQSGVRGLYPLGSLANHNCSPNAFHIYNSQRHMVVRASKRIAKGEEVFHSYSRNILGTLNRRLMLIKTKHFYCKCRRCSDPTEFGSYLSALRCTSCKVGIVLSIDPLNIKSDWSCDSCQKSIKCSQVGRLLSILGSTLASFGNDDFTVMVKFLNNKLLEMIHENHQVVVDLKCKIIFILGSEKHYTWNDLSDAHLQLKKQYCRDVLKVLEKLQCGYFKLRALVVYELYSTLKERNKRNKNEEQKNEELEFLLEEVRKVMKDDISAPLEIQESIE